MAEFCKSCSEDMWGFDTKDLAGISSLFKGKLK